MNILPKIHNEQDLNNFLAIDKNNIYVNFINLCKIKIYKTSEGPFEYHHIIPLYANGPNKQWNLIKLSIEDHIMAHTLLYKIYKNKEDLLALNFRKYIDKEVYKLRCTLSHDKQRLNKSGFFCSKVQQLNGQKGGKVKSINKQLSYIKKIIPEWKAILCKETHWYYKQTSYTLIIKPFECNLPSKITKKLFSYKPFVLNYKANKQSFTSNLTRMVKGERKSVSGWILVNN